MASLAATAAQIEPETMDTFVTAFKHFVNAFKDVQQGQTMKLDGLLTALETSVLSSQSAKSSPPSQQGALNHKDSSSLKATPPSSPSTVASSPSPSALQLESAEIKVADDSPQEPPIPPSPTSLARPAVTPLVTAAIGHNEKTPSPGATRVKYSTPHWNHTTPDRRADESKVEAKAVQTESTLAPEVKSELTPGPKTEPNKPPTKIGTATSDYAININLPCDLKCQLQVQETMTVANVLELVAREAGIPAAKACTASQSGNVLSRKWTLLSADIRAGEEIDVDIDFNM